MTNWWAIVVIVVGMLASCGKVKDEIACGDGEQAADEQCDEGALNGAPSSCCTSSCELAAASVVCRAAIGECDVAESCDGTSGACPGDATVADDTPCTGNGESLCSGADSCRAGVCDDNNATMGARCSDQPTCDPDVCDGAGACTDIAAVDDGATCADGGGNTCCGGGCVASATPGTCDPCLGPTTGALTIAIVESQSLSTAQNMDNQWKARAEDLGHVATIHPQTVLDNIGNLAAADILIVASHEIIIPAARRATITAFAASGRGVYIQGEFQGTFEGNVVFEEVIDSFGANFSWGAEVTGSLTATAQGCFASTPFAVAAMSQNFGVTGNASGAGLGVIETGTPAGGAPTPVGFRYCRSGGGLVVTTTDKDNIRAQSAGVPEFMKNIIYRLSYPSICPL